MQGNWQKGKRVWSDISTAAGLLLSEPLLSLAMALLLLFFIIPAQTTEVFLLYKSSGDSWPSFVRAATAVVFLNILWILFVHEIDYAHFRKSANVKPRTARLHWITSLLLFSSPTLVVALHVIATLYSAETPESLIAQFRWVFEALSVSLPIIGFLIFAERFVGGRRAHDWLIDLVHRHALIVLMPIAFLFVSWRVGLVAAGELTTQYDSIVYSVVFACTVIVIIGSASVWTALVDRPPATVAAILVVYGLVLTGFDWNDHFNIVTPDQSGVASPPSCYSPRPPCGDTNAPAEPTVGEWLSRQPDIDSFDVAGFSDHESAPSFPIFLIAAQGGGIYAAFHSAGVLARIQGADSKFLRRVFAVSGVSGGALGMASFLAAAYTLENVDPEVVKASLPKSCPAVASGPGISAIEMLVRCYYRHDMLAPVLGRGLFHDLPFFLVPSFIVGRTDSRAVTFETTIERNWTAMLSAVGATPEAAERLNYFTKPVDLTYTSRDAPFPFLLINATIVEDGSRVVLGPKIAEPLVGPSGAVAKAFKSIKLFDRIAKGSPKVSQAVVFSSSFPVLFPPQSLNRSGQQKIRLVDGGYTENSGLTTLAQLLDSVVESDYCAGIYGALNRVRNYLLVRVESKRGNALCVKVRTHVIYFTHRFKSFSAYYDGSAFSELWAPIRTILNARMQRSVDAETFLARRPDVTTHPFYLADDEFLPPLGLVLSEKTLARIEQRLGNTSSDQEVGEGRETVRLNNETFDRIVNIP